MSMYNPPHPGEIINEFWLSPWPDSYQGGEIIWVTRKTFSMLLNGKSGISPEMALRLSKVFGRTPEGWLKLQLQYDLWKAKKNVDIDRLERIAA